VKVLGIVFIMMSAVSSGFQVSFGLKKRCIHLRHLLQALRLLKNELLHTTTTLPKLFLFLSKSVQGAVGEMFADISKQMDDNRWMSPRTAMERTLQKYPDDVSGEILLELASNMGKYDIEAQADGIDIAVDRIEQLLSEMEKERSMKSKTYKTLSICAGLATVILLL